MTWFITEDLRDKSVLITEEEVQQDCIAGLRNSLSCKKTSKTPIQDYRVSWFSCWSRFKIYLSMALLLSNPHPSTCIVKYSECL